ncbi:MAG: FadR/GntR family transcriptional regulator [Myxococcota bacterium]
MTSRPAHQRRSDEVEHTIVQRIVRGQYPPGSRLPLERDLAAELGVGRPTLREAIQRLERDGWLTVRKSKGTIINDHWQTGGLPVLPGLVEHGGLSNELIIWLLELRVVLAPAYVAQAVAAHPARVVAVLVEHQSLPDEADAYAAFDLRWQRAISELAPNRLYAMIMRSFGEATASAYVKYFAVRDHRIRSCEFYVALMQAAMRADAERADAITRRMMKDSIDCWRARWQEDG